MCFGRHCAKTKDGESPGAIQLSHATRQRRWWRWRRHSNNYKGLRAKLSRAWDGAAIRDRSQTLLPFVRYRVSRVARLLRKWSVPFFSFFFFFFPHTKSFARVRSSECSDTQVLCQRLPLCYLFPSRRGILGRSSFSFDRHHNTPLPEFVTPPSYRPWLDLTS